MLLLKRLLGGAFVGDMTPLLWPSMHSPLLMQARADAIVSRVRGLALLFAVLTIAWSAVDFLFLPQSYAIDLAFARVVAGVAFAGLAVRTPIANATIADAYMVLALLFLIPVMFFVSSISLRDVPLEPVASTYVALTALAPFVMAMGLSLFPLVATEALVFGSFAAILQCWSLYSGEVGPGIFVSHAGVFWLLTMIVTIAALSCMTQVGLMVALIARSSRDELTGCYRRESGRMLLDMQWQQAKRNRTELALLFADLDKFKQVNDAFGHEAGDRVLAAAAGAMSAELRTSDRLIRWGGEEFVMILPDTSKRDAISLFQRMQQRGFGQRTDGVAITMSAGVAEFHVDHVTSADALVDLADHRMYLAKQAGRDQCVSEGAE